MSLRIFVIAAATLVWALAVGGVQAKKPAVEAGLSLEEIAVMLSSSELDEVRDAIEGAALLGSKDVIPMVKERIKAGLPAELLDSAMDALVMLGDPSAGDVFAALARHRRPNVRLRAIQALVALRVTDAYPVLVVALSDAAPEVREAAALGLGELNAKGSTDAVFKAFDREVPGAARSLGTLVNDEEVTHLLSYLGRVPLTTLTPIFDTLLARRDLNDATRLSIVLRLTELGTAEARGYLEGVSHSLAPNAPERLRRAVDEAVRRMAR
jgi:HEAT repeat protein